VPSSHVDDDPRIGMCAPANIVEMSVQFREFRTPCEERHDTSR
jgi:hypothetical protein